MTQAVIATTVTGMQGRPISTTVPATNQAYTWSGTAWAPTGPFLPLAGGVLTGPLRLQYGAPVSTIFNDTTTSITAGGLWRTVAQNGNLSFQSNTATAGDFSTVTGMTLTNAGALTVSGLQVNGAAGITGGVTVGGGVTTAAGITCNSGRVISTTSVAGQPCFTVSASGGASFGLYIDAANNPNLGIMNANGNPIGGASACVVWTGNNGGPGQDNTMGWGIPGRAWFQVVSYNFPQSSDPRTKKDIAAIPADPLAQVLAIPVHNYRYLNDAETAPLHWGFLSTEVHATMGDNFAGWVQGTDADQTESLNIMDMLAMLWAAVQEVAQKANIT